MVINKPIYVFQKLTTTYYEFRVVVTIKFIEKNIEKMLVN